MTAAKLGLITMSEEQLSLFAPDPVEQAVQDIPISEEQVQRILKAFENAGILQDHERKEIITSCVVRPVASFGDLLATDFRRILRRIDEHANRKPQRLGSAWETREEDTWIDRL